MATPDMTAAETRRTQPDPMSNFDLAAFHATPLQRTPFDFLVVSGFILPDALAAINRDYPQIEGPGNKSAEDLDCGPAFAQLLATLKSQAFAELVGEKFEVDLSGCAATIAVRRFSEATDGNIHTDHRSKVITLLLYFNPGWEHAGGRLRLLNSATDMEDYAGEVVPCCGTLLAFRRTDISWHGHKPFVGERRMLQLSWTRGGDVARYVSSLTKPMRRLLNMS
ncbi:MAG TPA: 2OG-Fe(II) oxygenase [Geminicoccaceae bacterium]|nr:2OG-Fe(II) oxygenase [Geminicoccaceae bacterium]